jgi:hypothetical protein
VTEPQAIPRAWFTVAELAERFHVEPITAWRLVRPYRARCHLARNGPHPRHVLWVPASVVEELERGRPWK